MVASKIGPQTRPGSQARRFSWFFRKFLSNLIPGTFFFLGGDDGLSLLLREIPSLKAGYILHSRWFSNSTDYARQNGGKFKFSIEHDSAAFPGNG